MIASIILNILIFAGIIGAILWALPKAEQKRIVFRYFTVLSNLLCAAASAAVVIARIAGALPAWVSILKYVGTCAVTVTLLTVFLFLAPSLGSFKDLLQAQDFLLHCLCPVLAIVSYVFFDQIKMSFGFVLLGTLPVLLYGIYYLYRVVYAPQEKRWEDFYTFNRGGKWPIAFAAMVLAAFVISVVLWAV
ncbi:MAG: hypothetical protein IJM39_04310 [Firmicutes bacterium]|nr:hypothetical protein [Bacillota bacterium]